MPSVREGLLRLGSAAAAARAGAWARRWHTRLLGGAALLAWVSSALVPLPLLGGLRGQWTASLAAAGLLVAAGLALRILARPLLTPRPERLAARLDDERGWKDAAGTALGVEARGASSPVASHLVAHAADLLQREPLAPGPAARRAGRPWLRIAFVALFLCALLLPGVHGLLGRGGAGGTPPPPTPADADAWLREHARLRLDRVHPEDRCSLVLDASFTTTEPLPAAYAGTLVLVWDDALEVPFAAVRAERGAPARVGVGIDLGAIVALGHARTEGAHRVAARLVPSAPPFSQALRTDAVAVEVCGPGGGGGGAGGKPPPEPPPEPPPTPERPPTEPKPPPPPPPPSGREEAVRPLTHDGETVKKDAAVVEVRAPDAGTQPPPAVPLADALREFDRVVERAVGSERIPAADKDYLRRYFRALQRLAGPGKAPPR